MPSDAARFVATFLDAATLPLPLAAGWRLESVEADRVRAGVALLLACERGARVVAYAEPRVEGPAAYVRTRRLNLSYYGDVERAEGASLAEAFRALATRLEAAEASGSDAWLEQVFRAEQPPDMRRTTEVEVHVARACNLACRFCNTPATSDLLLTDVDEARRMLDDARRRGAVGVTFTGREPTIFPGLPDLIRRARDLGYERVRIQTNGLTLARRGEVGRLLAAGLTDVHLSLHTLDGATFEAMLGPRQGLAKVEAALANLLEVPVFEAYVLVVVTSLNLAELPALIERLARDYRYAPDHVALSPLAPVGDAASAPDLWPRYDQLTPGLEAALEAARRWSLAVSIPARCGAPLCVVPARWRDDYERALTREGLIPEPGKARVAACRGCRVEAMCPGPWSVLVNRLGSAGIGALP